jgi:predicted dehydrogenase
MADQVRMGIVGLGAQGGFYATLIDGGRVPRTVIGAICDIDPAKRALAGERYPGVPVYDSYEEMLASGDVDAVVTCVPHFLHPEMGIQAVQRGIHALVEKPAGVYSKQVRQLNEFADSHPETTFAIMFNQRTNPLYRDLKALLDSGELGGLRRWTWTITTWWRPQGYYNQSEWRATWGGEGGGVLVNQAPHQIDLSQWMLGLPKRVYAKLAFGFRRDIAVEDEVVAVYDYGDGVTGTFITCTHDIAGTDRLEILLDRGKIVVENSKTVTVTRLVDDEKKLSDEMTMDDVRQIFMGGDLVSRLLTTDTKTYESVWGQQHADVLTNFTDHVLDGTPLIADGQDGINGVRLANSIHLSSWLGEEVDVAHDEDLYLEELNRRIVGEGKFPAQAG